MTHTKRLTLILLILQTTSQCIATFDCNITRCDCRESPNRGYDITCPDDSDFIVKVSLDFEGAKDLEINCNRNLNYVNYLPSTYLPPEIPDVHLEYLGFIMCSLPGNVTVREVMKELRIANTNILRITYANLGNITRNDLDGLQDLKHLEVMRNVISYTPKDLLYDLKQLQTIDMKTNDIVIPQEFFHGTPYLQNIEIAENYLPDNTTGMFRNLTRLKHLNMWMMKINTLQPDIFNNLSNLETLDLSLNQITDLNSTIFETLKKLKVLSLKRNLLVSLPKGIFDNNTYLEFINLNENKELTTLPDLLFADKKYLKNITMEYCNLTTLPSNLFKGSNNIELIDFSRNHIEELPVDLFKDQKNLKVLLLENNYITTISSEFFSRMDDLSLLNLNDNFLELTRDNFQGLTKLKSLHLSNNNIRRMYPEMFRTMKELTELDLSYNALTLLEESNQDIFGKWSIMDDLHHLQMLNLQHNNISVVFVDWKVSKPKLRVLDLSYNHFNNVTYNDFDFIQEKIEVNMEHNKITNIDFSHAETLRQAQILSSNDTIAIPSYKPRKEIIVKLKSNPLHCSCNLYHFYRYLDLTMSPEVRDVLKLQTEHLNCSTPEDYANKPVNEIKSKKFVCDITKEAKYLCPELATCYWKPYGEVLTIDLAYAGISQAPILNALRDHQKLRFQEQVILLQGNNLKQMPQRGIGYENVNFLDLSYNDISTIDWIPHNLNVLKLHNNNLTFLNNYMLTLLNNSKLTNLTLYNNPWKCNCSTTLFLQFIQNKFEMLSNLQDITCASNNKQISLLTEDKLCPMPTQLIIIICFIVTFTSMLIAILAGLYYRYNIEIKVWLFAHQQCLWLVTEEELDKDKIYDAFISYSHKDEDFIIEKLIANLEQGPRPYKLCLHFRNWQPGEFITKNIANSVAESRRTIVILSPNFLESEWGKMEFRTAHKQALEENRARVIIILLGDVPMDDLDEEIKAYLNTNTYLKWGDPWFWDKLRYALPHSPKFVNEYQSLEKITVDGDKLDLIHEPPTPPIESTPPVDKITYDPMKKGMLDVKLVNGSLVNKGYENEKLHGKHFISR